MSTKSAAENAQEFAQSAISAAPVIILGSGASAAEAARSALRRFSAFRR